MKFLITAGGQGTKLWPYSTKSEPKQFQPILGQKSLYQHNIDVLLNSYDASDIFVVTKKSYLHYIEEQTPQIPKENRFIEPDIRRDRGPAEGLAALRLQMLFPDEPFMIVQSDCIREPSDRYLTTVAEIERMVLETGKFVTGGLKTEQPIVGIDYLALGKKIPTKSGIKVHEIANFVWRPQTMAEIEKVIQGAEIITHSNHMAWYPDKFLNAYKQYRPDWYDALMRIKEVIDDEAKVDQIYAEMDKGATEVVTANLMDKGEAIAVVLPYKWSDIGSWSSLYDYFADEGQNYIDAKALVLDSNNSIVKGQGKRLIALLGVDNIAVIETDNALLVVDRSRSADVGMIIDELGNRGLEEYL